MLAGRRGTRARDELRRMLACCCQPSAPSKREGMKLPLLPTKNL
eukprot:COSAG04_NODE_28904_length_272_cov_0.901734_1_plen_43_part_01